MHEGRWVMGECNRYLRDKGMDHIDHALGRPVDPMVEGYRNRFVTDTASDLAASFRASPHWEEVVQLGDGMAVFRVTQEGRRALRAHLRAIGDRHRHYTVRWGEYSWTVVARSRDKARYSAWLDLSDTTPDLTFGAFLRGLA